MPIDYNDYPDDWKTRIRPDILERAGNCCEFCGVHNHLLIWRHLTEPEKYMWYDHEKDRWYTDDGREWHMRNIAEVDENYSLESIQVVLTIAHLDHDVTNNDYDNLRALCQRCHNVYDAPNRAKNAAITRRNNYIEQTGQQELWSDES